MLAAHAQLQARMHRDQSRAADHGGGAITTTQMLPATLRAAIERARGPRAEASQGAFAAGGKLPIASMKTGGSLSSPTQASAAIAPSGESPNAETSGVQLAALAAEQGQANDQSRSDGYWQQQHGEAGMDHHQHHVAVGGSSVRGSSGSPTRRLARGKQAKAGPLVAMLARCWRQTAQDAALLDHYHMQQGARKHPSPVGDLASSSTSSSSSALSASGTARSPVLKETRAPQHRPWVVLEAVDSRCVGPHAWVRCLVRATSDDSRLKRSSDGGLQGREGAGGSGAGGAAEEEELLQSMLDQEDVASGGSGGYRPTGEALDAERLPAATATAPTAAASPTPPTEPESSCMARGLTPETVGLAAGQEVVALFGASRWSWLCSAGGAPAWLRAGARGEDARSGGSGFQATSVAKNASAAVGGDGVERERAGFCVRVHGPFSVLTKGSGERGVGQHSLGRVGSADPGGGAGAAPRSKGGGREEQRGLPVLLSTAMSVAVRSTV